LEIEIEPLTRALTVFEIETVPVVMLVITTLGKAEIETAPLMETTLEMLTVPVVITETLITPPDFNATFNAVEDAAGIPEVV